MFKKIRKRDGNIVKFDSSKITVAIAKAGKATSEFGEAEAEKLTLRVLDLSHESSPGPLPDVEGIQDIVERVLFDTAFFKSAKAYILYREQHAQIRAIAAKASVDLVDSYLKELDWKICENSNMSYSLQGLNNYISDEKRCIEAGIPQEHIGFHRKHDLALQLVIQARLQGIAFGWVGADSLYDEDPSFLRFYLTRFAIISSNFCLVSSLIFEPLYLFRHSFETKYSCPK